MRLAFTYAVFGEHNELKRSFKKYFIEKFFEFQTAEKICGSVRLYIPKMVDILLLYPKVSYIYADIVNVFVFYVLTMYSGRIQENVF